MHLVKENLSPIPLYDCWGTYREGKRPSAELLALLQFVSPFLPTLIIQGVSGV